MVAVGIIIHPIPLRPAPVLCPSAAERAPAVRVLTITPSHAADGATVLGHDDEPSPLMGARDRKEYKALKRAYQAQPCHWCGIRRQPGGPPMTVDHEPPLALGGDNSRTVPACMSCNSSRGARLGNTLRGWDWSKPAPTPTQWRAPKRPSGWPT